MKIFPVEGEIDKNNEFGFTKDRRGMWKWVHLKTGEWSRKSYKTEGTCRAAIRKMRNRVLFEPDRGIYRTRHYRYRVAQFHAAVAREDAGFFERFGIKAAEPAVVKEARG
jgi:hypothetical protein